MKKHILFRLFLVFIFIQSCTSINRDYFLKQNSNNPASIEVIKKILYIEKYMLNQPEELGTVYTQHAFDIGCLSNIKFESEGNWSGNLIPDSITVEKWKKWYLKNSNNFRYAHINEFSKDSIEYFRVIEKGKAIEIYFEKIIVLENKKDSIYTNSECLDRGFK